MTTFLHEAQAFNDALNDFGRKILAVIKDNIGLINLLYVQFFFIRICKRKDIKSGKIDAWGILYFVMPFTGWRSDYIYLFGTNKIIWIWKVKEMQ